MNSRRFRYWKVCKYCGTKWMEHTIFVEDYYQRLDQECWACVAKRSDPPEAEAQSGSDASGSEPR